MNDDLRTREISLLDSGARRQLDIHDDLPRLDFTPLDGFAEQRGQRLSPSLVVAIQDRLDAMPDVAGHLTRRGIVSSPAIPACQR